MLFFYSQEIIFLYIHCTKAPIAFIFLKITKVSKKQKEFICSSCGQEEIAKAIGAIGKIANQWTFGIVEAVGEGTAVANMHQKRKFAIKNSQIFQKFLAEEENNLSSFNKLYTNLISGLKQGKDLEIVPIITNCLDLEEQLTSVNIEPKLFTTTYYQIYQVATNIWENKAHLTAEDMKETIAVLQTNLLDLRKELIAQEKAFKERRINKNQELINQKENEIKELKEQIVHQITLLQSSNDQQVESLGQCLDKLNQLLTKEEQSVKVLKETNEGLKEQLTEAKDKEIDELKKLLSNKEQEVTNFKQDNWKLIVQLLANEKKELEQLTKAVKSGQLKLVDTLLTQQAKVQDLERYVQDKQAQEEITAVSKSSKDFKDQTIQTEPLEQQITKQRGQQVILDEYIQKIEQPPKP